MRSVNAQVVGVFLTLAMVGCKKGNGLLPAEGTSAQAAPAAAAAAGHGIPAEGELPTGHPPIGAAAGDAANAGPSVSGVIDVDPALAKQVKAGDVIFVIARTAAGQMAAVQKLAAPDKFPLPFTLTGNGPMAMGPLSGSIKISARVDKDGDAMSKNPGDVIGEVPDLVSVPSQNVKLVLNKTL